MALWGYAQRLVVGTLSILATTTVLRALARFDPPASGTGPRAEVAPPAGRSAHAPRVLAAGGRTVQVLGSACGLGIEGSGWVAGAAGLVVTNEHVVAGES